MILDLFGIYDFEFCISFSVLYYQTIFNATF